MDAFAAYLSLLFWLVVVHAVADYPLQGDFLAKGKNHRDSIPGVPWWICLAAHATIHAGGVALVTGSLLMGGFEFVMHCMIDYSKCDRRFDFTTDQCLHILTKVVIAIIVVF